MATKIVATRRFVSSDPDAMILVAQVVKCQVAIRSWIARNLARKSTFPLSRPPITTLGQELGCALRGANMNHIYDQALAQAEENKVALKNVPEQASDLGRQIIPHLWQYSIFNKPIQGGENENNQKELSMSLIRSSSYFRTGQRFSGNDPIERQSINETISMGFNNGQTGRSIKDFEKVNLKLRVTDTVLKLYDDLEVE